MQKAIIVAIVVVALIVIGWALLRTGQEPAAPAATVETPAEPGPVAEAVDPVPVEAPARVPAPEPAEPLPPLAESDAFVRERLEPMELPDAWVEQGDYVRRLAVLAENASRGDYPRRQLAFLIPSEPFRVTAEGDRLFIDPVSYDRYDSYVAELESVDPAALAGLLDTLSPLVETALGEIGVTAPPGQVFAAAAQQVLAVPVLQGPVEVVQPKVMYEFANPELEALAPLQKQVLRMGPENVERLQAYLRRLAAELGLDVAAAGA